MVNEPVPPAADINANITPVAPPVVPAPENPPINAGQPAGNPNDVPVTTTKETPTPAVETTTIDSLDDFFAGLGIVDDKPPVTPPAVPETPATPATPEAPAAPAEPAPVIPDAIKQQIADLETAKNLAEKNYKTVQPVAEALEKNPTMRKFFEAVVSGKVTFEGVFQKFAEAQLSKPVKAPSSSAGTPPVQASLQDRLMGLSSATRESDNLNYRPTT